MKGGFKINRNRLEDEATRILRKNGFSRDGRPIREVIKTIIEMRESGIILIPSGMSKKKSGIISPKLRKK